MGRAGRVSKVLALLKLKGIILSPVAVTGRGQRYVYVDALGHRYAIRTANLYEHSPKYEGRVYSYQVWMVDFSRVPKGVRFVLLTLLEEDRILYIWKIPVDTLQSTSIMISRHRLDHVHFEKEVLYP